MKYHIERLNRTVELYDRIVEEYTKYEKLRDQPFSIIVRNQFGHAPSQEEISDNDLSELCNEILLTELKAIAALPVTAQFIRQHENEYKESSDNNIIREFTV